MTRYIRLLLTLSRGQYMPLIYRELETIKQLVEAYPGVFAEGVGLLAGQYHIRIDPTVEPTQDAPR